jgi:hypothetical protein
LLTLYWSRLTGVLAGGYGGMLAALLCILTGPAVWVGMLGHAPAVSLCQSGLVLRPLYCRLAGLGRLAAGASLTAMRQAQTLHLATATEQAPSTSQQDLKT